MQGSNCENLLNTISQEFSFSLWIYCLSHLNNFHWFTKIWYALHYHYTECQMHKEITHVASLKPQCIFAFLFLLGCQSKHLKLTNISEAQFFQWSFHPVTFWKDHQDTVSCYFWSNSSLFVLSCIKHLLWASLKQQIFLTTILFSPSAKNWQKVTIPTVHLNLKQIAKNNV